MAEWIFRRHLSTAALTLSSLLLLAAAADFAERRWLVVESMRIAGGNHAVRAAAAEMLQNAIGVRLLDVDLFDWKRRLENLPGIARAELTRAPPNGVRVRIETPTPLARWDGGGLIDIYGELHAGVAGAELPIFKGREGYAQNMMELYDDAKDILRDDVVAQLELSAGGDWRVFLQNELVLYLGRTAPRRRLARYARHADALRKRFPRMRAVDLRHERGFTVINGAADIERQAIERQAADIERQVAKEKHS